jgi:predicted outer membrane repeat protein
MPQAGVLATSCTPSGYSSPYSITTSATALDTVLNAWISIACWGTIRFTTNNARIRLLSEYSLTGKLQLDASGLANGVTLVAASNKRFFTINDNANLTAKGVTFADSQFRSSSTVWGGGFYFGYSSGMFEGCTFRNITAFSDINAIGGAMYLAGGTYVFRNCVFQDNNAIGYNWIQGGAIYADDPDAIKLTVVGTSFINNRAMVSAPCESFMGTH